MYIVTSGATATSSNSGVSHSASWDSMPPPPLAVDLRPAGRGSRRLLAGRLLLGQGEDDQRASVAGAEHPRQEAFGPAAPADRHGDVLPAVHHVGRRAAVVAAAALELPQQLPRPGVEGVVL